MGGAAAVAFFVFVAVVKEVDALMDPFGGGDEWAVGMRLALMKINSVVAELGLGTVNSP